MLVCGGRSYENRPKVFGVLDAIHSKTPISVIVSGGARGADRLAEEWAAQRLVECRIYKPNWRKFGKAAGPMRNMAMLSKEQPDLVVAFPGGPGTANMVGISMDADVEVLDVREDKW